jgi:hypothetical protein
MAKKNPFAALLQPTPKTFELDGMIITYRELTVGEDDAFNMRLVKGFKEVDGEMKPDIDMKEANAIKYEKIAAMLIEPKLTTDDLHKLPKSTATKLFNGMLDDDEEIIDSEGN